MSFWQSLRRGPWSKHVTQRIERALEGLSIQLSALDGLAAVVVFGSYARAEAGRTSDLDLFILFHSGKQQRAQSSAALGLVSHAESDWRLPVHFVPFLAACDELELVGDLLLHAITTEGVVLYGRLAALTRLDPRQPSPEVIVTFSLADAPAATRMRLNRRLHGYVAMRTRDGKRQRVRYPGLIAPPAHSLGSGVFMMPGEQWLRVRDVLDESGATYTKINVWVTK